VPAAIVVGMTRLQPPTTPAREAPCDPCPEVAPALPPPAAPLRLDEQPRADALAPVLARAVLMRANGKKRGKPATKNKRALAAIEAATITLPEKRGGSKKKAQIRKHEVDHERNMRATARKILASSEGGVGIGGHSRARHSELSDEALQARLASIRVATTFDTVDDQVDAVCTLLIEWQREIEQWLRSDEPQFLAYIAMPEGVAAHGFERPRAAPVHLTTDDLPWVIAPFRKDDVGSHNPWGLITCFPAKELPDH